MRQNKSLLFIFLVVGFSIIYYLWGNKTAEISNPVESVKESIDVVNGSIDQVSIQDKLKQNKANIAPLKKLLDERVSAFNQNPAIDALLIKANLGHCLEIVNADNNQVESWKSNDKLSVAQKKHMEELDIYCEKLNSNHPEYMLTNEGDIKLLRDSIDKDGEIGKIISMQYNNISDSEIIEPKIKLLKQTNPNLLFNLWRYFSSYIYKELDNRISEIIKSNDRNYVSIVRLHALDYYACDAGANCAENSNLVTNLCFSNDLCGNNFNEILITKMPAGIRADILIVFNYLKEILD